MKKKSQLIITISLLFTFISCKGQVDSDRKINNGFKHTQTNQLINESSPYLLQHAHNPVNWHPWNEKTLEKAKKENKMLIISVGYAACHWCHVMMHESFEDTTVANIMNKYFIPIKIDREERPDVDQIYMNAAHLIHGSGGWPLNAFALPNGKPFFAGTYYPRDQWIKVLNYFVDLRNEKPESLVKQAEKITQGIQDIESVSINKTKTTYSLKQLNDSFNRWKGNIDFKKGGGKRAPKFPMPSTWEYLLHYSYLSNNEEALKAVTTTLDNMAFGGIYDHIGGGFARYSTDANWHVPHFEKMLYDNGQLMSLYSKAYQKTKNPLYKKIVYETLEFIEREMTSSKGGFYSSLNADSENEEGKFYVWKKGEIDNILGDKNEIFNKYYNITKLGNWEKGKNILYREESNEVFAEKHDLTIEELQIIIENGKSKLFKARSERIRPTLDNKILTSWNALMMKGYIQAYQVFNEAKFLEIALKNAQFLLNNAIAENGKLTRNHLKGKSSIPGMLDDYAFVTSAFIELYQATFDQKWLQKANALTTYTQAHFFNPTSEMFYYTHDNHSSLISRKMEVSDNVIPSSNSEMAKNLYFLGTLLYNESYIELAEQMLSNVHENVMNNTNFFSNWAVLEAHVISPPFEVAILGEHHERVLTEMNQEYMPNVLYLGGNEEGQLTLLENKLVKGQTTIYVCQNKACKLPVTEASKAILQIK